MERKVFVTGGAGYIGSHTCLELLKVNDSVMVYDNLCNSSIDNINTLRQLTNKAVSFEHGDIRNHDQLLSAMEEFSPDVVIHFAGLKSVGESTVDPLKYYDVNIAGSVNLLKAMGQTHCKEIIFSSSATVYGEASKPPFNEESPVNPISPYGITKLAFEKILADWVSALDGRKAVSLRYFNPVGAHNSGLLGEQPLGAPSNLMPLVAMAAAGEIPYLAIFGNDYDTRDGTGERDYIHVSDLARGHVAAMSNLEKITGFETFNLGTGKGTTVMELVSEYEACSGLTIPLKIVGRRAGDVSKSLADVQKSQLILGFECIYNITDMCRDVYNHRSR